MKDLVSKILSQADAQCIIDAVKKAEKLTSAEIVPTIVNASYHYPLTRIYASFVLSLPLAIALTYYIAPLFYFHKDNLWIFIVFFSLLFIVFKVTIAKSIFLTRLFLNPREVDAEVREAAITAFYKNGLYKTADKNGVLVYITLLEKKVWILADEDAHKKIEPEFWDSCVQQIIEGIKQKQFVPALCATIETIGNRLAKEYPVKHDDVDELKNIIIGDNQ
ncbi:MAG: TPM domain-containing protein [Spirochaetota bacterium]